jgi:hypothetical protein
MRCNFIYQFVQLLLNLPSSGPVQRKFPRLAGSKPGRPQPHRLGGTVDSPVLVVSLWLGVQCPSPFFLFQLCQRGPNLESLCRAEDDLCPRHRRDPGVRPQDGVRRVGRACQPPGQHVLFGRRVPVGLLDGPHPSGLQGGRQGEERPHVVQARGHPVRALQGARDGGQGGPRDLHGGQQHPAHVAARSQEGRSCTTALATAHAA